MQTRNKRFIIDTARVSHEDGWKFRHCLPFDNFWPIVGEYLSTFRWSSYWDSASACPLFYTNCFVPVDINELRNHHQRCQEKITRIIHSDFSVSVLYCTPVQNWLLNLLCLRPTTYNLRTLSHRGQKMRFIVTSSRALSARWKSVLQRVNTLPAGSLTCTAQLWTENSRNGNVLYIICSLSTLQIEVTCNGMGIDPLLIFLYDWRCWLWDTCNPSNTSSPIWVHRTISYTCIQFREIFCGLHSTPSRTFSASSYRTLTQKVGPFRYRWRFALAF